MTTTVRTARIHIVITRSESRGVGGGMTVSSDGATTGFALGIRWVRRPGSGDDNGADQPPSSMGGATAPQVYSGAVSGPPARVHVCVELSGKVIVYDAGGEPGSPFSPTVPGVPCGPCSPCGPGSP